MEGDRCFHRLRVQWLALWLQLFPLLLWRCSWRYQFWPPIAAQFYAGYRATKSWLGTFIATFIYCLLVLRTIHGEGDGYSFFVPHLSVTVGTVLAIASMGVLIYFIHHASTIIQVSHVITQVSGDLDKTIDRLFPEQIGHSAAKKSWPFGEIPANLEEKASPVKAAADGYLQAIDYDELMKITRKYSNPRISFNNWLTGSQEEPGNRCHSCSASARLWRQSLRICVTRLCLVTSIII